MKEVKHRIMLVQMLFGDEFIIMVERQDVHLFIWKQKGRCVDLFEKSHSVVNVTIFMSSYIANLTAETERAMWLLDVKMQNTYRIMATKKLKQIINSNGQIDVLQKKATARDGRTE